MKDGAAETRHDDQLEYYRGLSDNAEGWPFRFASRRVVVVGAGGLGSELMRHLGAAGVAHIVCIDPDRVRLSNLNRQHFFTPGDVGRLKVDCIAERFKTVFPETEIAPVCKFINFETDLLECILPGPVDFVACCADEPVGAVEQACIATAISLNCPVGFTAMHLRRGYWGVARSRSSQTQARTFFKEAEAHAAVTKAKPVKGSSSWTNSVIGALFAEAVLLTIAGNAPAEVLSSFDFGSMSAAQLLSFGQQC